MEKINSVKCFCKLNKPKVKFIYKSKPKYETNFFIKKKIISEKLFNVKRAITYTLSIKLT